MSTESIQIGYIFAVNTDNVENINDFYDVKIIINEKEATLNLSYDRKIAFVVTYESDEYVLDFTSEDEISAIRDELILKIKEVGLELNILKPIKKFFNVYYDGSDNPLSLIKYDEYY